MEPADYNVWKGGIVSVEVEGSRIPPYLGKLEKAEVDDRGRTRVILNPHTHIYFHGDGQEGAVQRIRDAESGKLGVDHKNLIWGPIDLLLGSHLEINLVRESTS